MKNSPYWAYITHPTPSVQMSQVLNLDIKSFISKNKFQMAHAGSRVKTKGRIFAYIISSKPAVGWFSLRQWRRHKISDFWQNCEKFCTVGKQPPELTMMFVLTMNFRESRQSLEGEQEMLESLEASLS